MVPVGGLEARSPDRAPGVTAKGQETCRRVAVAGTVGAPTQVKSEAFHKKKTATLRAKNEDGDHRSLGCRSRMSYARFF